MKFPTWSTHELKERGWTPGMIKDLLGSHDAERASDIRVGSRGRRAGGTVKLYRQTRVEEMERTQRYADAEDRARAAQDRAQTAADTRRATRERQIESIIERYPKTLTPHPDPASLSASELRDHHWTEPMTYKGDQSDALGRLSRQERERLFYGVNEAHTAALQGTYPEHFPSGEE